MFIRVNNGHLRVRNGTTAVGCGIRMPRNVHFAVPSGHSINKKLFEHSEKIMGSGNIDRITKDIAKAVISKESHNKNKPKKYIKF